MSNDLFRLVEDNGFGEFFVVFAIIAGIVILAILAVAVVTYVFQSLGLMEAAKKNNIPNPWLAWIPVGNMYILGKLGFEIYAPSDKKNETFTWILFGCSAGSVILSESPLIVLVSIATVVFSTWAYYYIFNKITPKNSVLFTVLTAIFNIGGIILFFNRKNLTNENNNVNKIVEENIENKKEEEKSKFCAYCGNKLNKTSKFCSKCGSKI